MLTVSYNAAHTPFQQPSGELVKTAGLDILTCDSAVTLPNITQNRLVSNAILEGMDIAIARLLEDLNLATLNPERTRITSLHLDNTLLVIAGDNGTFGTVVKPPFSPERSKGTVYETGVWVPLMVAGDLVKEPGRTVDALVNVADLFELFAEAAGVDVRDPDVVPASHRLDSRPLLPYLTNPAQPDIRRSNFTQLGIGFFQTPVTAPATPASVPERNWPCILGSSASLDLEGICVEGLIGNEARCEDNAGVWYGPRDSCPDPDDPDNPLCQMRATNCCDAHQMAGNSQGNIQSIQQFAVRNREFKLVMLENEDCTAPIDPSTPPSMRPFPWAEYDVKTVREFYPLQPTVMNPAGIDRPQDNLLKDCQLPNPADCLPPPLRPIFNELNDELNRILNSEAPCPGDGNLDKVVDQLDLDGVEAFMNRGPSFFDFNLDAETDDLDRDIALQNFGNCLQAAIPPSTVSSGSFQVGSQAPNSIVSTFGSRLATGVKVATSTPLPIILQGTTVKIVDSRGMEGSAPLYFVAPGQINWLIPDSVSFGPATITYTSGDGTSGTEEIEIVPVAPALFTANSSGEGVPAATAMRVSRDGTQTPVPVFLCGDQPGSCVPVPIDMGSEGDEVILLLFGTGFRGHSGLENVRCLIGAEEAEVLAAQAQGGFVGLDQSNVRIPRNLIGRGEVEVVFIVDGETANVVTINIQ